MVLGGGGSCGSWVAVAVIVTATVMVALVIVEGVLDLR